MTAKARFTRTVEDFRCGNCGATVNGTGYTNHCPHCLFSRHVDINPGDRACTCQGMMRPVRVEIRSGDTILEHHCLDCGAAKRNKAAKDDNFDAVLAIMRNT